MGKESLENRNGGILKELIEILTTLLRAISSIDVRPTFKTIN
jgi:hypothetical protein